MIGVAGVIKQRLDGQQQRLDGQPGPLRRTLLHLRPPVKQLGGAACDGTSGRAVGRAGDAIWWVWWALHGLRCSSGAYAHI